MVSVRKAVGKFLKILLMILVLAGVTGCGLKQESGKDQSTAEVAASAQQREETEETEGELDETQMEGEGSVRFEYTDYNTAVPEMTDSIRVQVERINAGEILKEVTGLKELENRYALIALNGIIAKDQETGEERNEGGQVTIYVPNLINGLEEVSILFYGRESQKWEIILADMVNPDHKTVTMTLTEPGIVTVIYKR